MGRLRKLHPPDQDFDAETEAAEDSQLVIELRMTGNDKSGGNFGSLEAAVKGAVWTAGTP
jgi:hypothetical protein